MIHVHFVQAESSQLLHLQPWQSRENRFFFSNLEKKEEIDWWRFYYVFDDG